MNRRKFFQSLPLAAVGVSPLLSSLPAKAESSPTSSPAEMKVEDLFEEMECQFKQYDPDSQEPKVIWRCGQRFKFLKYQTSYPACPKCGAMQYLAPEKLREIAGLPV
jgi:hypothetical protein